MDSDGLYVADFIETFCRLTKGPHAGETITLRPWQREILEGVYQLRDDGHRQYRRGLLGMPRKNGKSLLGAGIALYGVLGDGEQGAEVYSCAGEKEQARIVFGEGKRMVELDPELSKRLKVYRDAMEDKKTGSVWRVLSAESYSKEGLNPSLVIFDEVHVQPDEELWNTMTLGSGTREQPLVLGITTAGFDKETLCGRLYDYGRRIQSGELHDDSFYFHWLEPGDPSADYKDPKVWAECNPAFGDFLYPEDFETAAKQTPEYAFRRYRLNQWTSVADAWLPFGTWSELAHGALEGEVVLGFDGAYNGDCTGLVACDLHGHLEVIALWEKPPDESDWRVPIEEVEDTIRATCLKMPVLEVVCDPYRWQRSMQVLENEGLPMTEFPQSAARMVPACTRFYDSAINGKLSHDGDKNLARHVNNAAVKVDRLGPRIVKQHKTSSHHIDLAVAAVMAYARSAHLAEQGTGYLMMFDDA